MSKSQPTDIFKALGISLVAILGAVMAYGALNANVDNIKVELIEVKAELQAEKKLFEDWRARVLPLDADQSAQLDDLERRVDRLELRLDQLEQKL